MTQGNGDFKDSIRQDKRRKTHEEWKSEWRLGVLGNSCNRIDQKINDIPLETVGSDFTWFYHLLRDYHLIISDLDLYEHLCKPSQQAVIQSMPVAYMLGTSPRTRGWAGNEKPGCVSQLCSGFSCFLPVEFHHLDVKHLKVHKEMNEIYMQYPLYALSRASSRQCFQAAIAWKEANEELPAIHSLLKFVASTVAQKLWYWTRQVSSVIHSWFPCDRCVAASSGAMWL